MSATPNLPATAEPAGSRPNRLLLIAAFAAMYVFWGGSYLGIRFSLESISPFLLPALRFLIAGVLLFAFARLTGAALPTRRQLRNCAVAGVIMFVFNNALLVWCQRHGVPSGIASILIATSPFWFVLFNWMRGGERPTVMIAVGLLVGFGGIALLINPATAAASGIPLIPAVGTMAAAMFWVAGSLFSRDAELPPSPFMAVAVQLLCGGAANLLLATLAGEVAAFDPAAVTARSWAALFYLAIFASIIALSAYNYLLRHVSAAWVSTYAYINPIVAVSFGWLLAGETLAPQAVLATAIVISSVVLITGGKRLNPTSVRAWAAAQRARRAEKQAALEAERSHLAAPGG